VNGSLSARDIRTRSRRTCASGKNIGRTCGGTISKQTEGRPQMPLRLAQQLIESGAQFPSFFASEHFLDPATVVLQYCCGTNN